MSYPASGSESLNTSFTAEVHTVTEKGVHRSIYLKNLAEMSLEAVLATEPIEAPDNKYPTIAHIPHVVWVDFPELNQPSAPTSTGDWVKRMEDNTHLVVGQSTYEEARYRFMTATDVLRLKVVPACISNWLPPFLRLDKPHPPLPMSRTDAIRHIAALPLSTTIDFDVVTTHPDIVDIKTIKALQGYVEMGLLPRHRNYFVDSYTADCHLKD
jgi:hypothetical protein